MRSIKNIYIPSKVIVTLVSLLAYQMAVAGPLHEAVKMGNIDEVERLIKEGVDVNSIEKNTTPLVIAADKGYSKIANFLVRHGADVNLKIGRYGDTPLYSASRNHACLVSPCTISPGVKAGQAEIAALLIRSGADVNATLGDGSTALMGAAICNAVDIAQLLIDSGADLNHRGNQYTALEIASSRGPDVAILLIKSGAKVNTSDYSTKESPLHKAAKCGYHDLVKVLLQHGADTSAINQWGKTPLDMANDPISYEAIKQYMNK